MFQKNQAIKMMNYIKFLCARFIIILSDIYFRTKRPKKIRQEKFWTKSSLHV